MDKKPTNKKQDNVNKAKQTQVKQQQNKLTTEQEIAILKQDMVIITKKVTELIKNQDKVLDLLYVLEKDLKNEKESRQAQNESECCLCSDEFVNELAKEIKEKVENVFKEEKEDEDEYVRANPDTDLDYNKLSTNILVDTAYRKIKFKVPSYFKSYALQSAEFIEDDMLGIVPLPGVTKKHTVDELKVLKAMHLTRVKEYTEVIKSLTEEIVNSNKAIVAAELYLSEKE